MIIRIVRLTLKTDKIAEFKKHFSNSFYHIRNFPGCNYLSLYHDYEKPQIMITYSKWKTADDLENYRNSELFRLTWSKVKPLFESPASAFSMIEEIT